MGCRSNGLSELWVVGIMLRIRWINVLLLTGMLPILHPQKRIQSTTDLWKFKKYSIRFGFIYLSLFLLFCERKVLFEISYVHVTTFWFTHNYIQRKIMTSVNPDTTIYQYTDPDLSISQHTQWRTMKTFQCVSISNTHHSTRHYFIYFDHCFQ